MPTKQKPSELLFAYKQKTILDSVKSTRQSVEIDSTGNQNKSVGTSCSQKQLEPTNQSVVTESLNTKNCQQIKYTCMEKICIKNHVKSNIKWIPCKYLRPKSKFTHFIMLNGKCRLVHYNQIRKTNLHDKFPIGVTMSSEIQSLECSQRQETSRSTNENFLCSKSPKPSLKRGRSPASPRSEAVELRRSKRIRDKFKQHNFRPNYKV